MLTQLPAMPL